MQKRRTDIVLFIVFATVWLWALSGLFSSDTTKRMWLDKCAHETGGKVVKETSETRRTAASRGNGFDYYVQLPNGQRVNYGERYADTTDRFPLP